MLCCGTASGVDESYYPPPIFYPIPLSSLFALFYNSHLPQDYVIIGYARSPMTTDTFRESLMSRMTCRLDRALECARDQENFLSRCFYVSGRYDSLDDFQASFFLRHIQVLLVLFFPAWHLWASN